MCGVCDGVSSAQRPIRRFKPSVQCSSLTPPVQCLCNFCQSHPSTPSTLKSTTALPQAKPHSRQDARDVCMSDRLIPNRQTCCDPVRQLKLERDENWAPQNGSAERSLGMFSERTLPPRPPTGHGSEAVCHAFDFHDGESESISLGFFWPLKSCNKPWRMRQVTMKCFRRTSWGRRH